MANILGIKLSELSKNDLLKKIISILNNNQQNYLVTPNPEIILKAQKDEELFYILNKANLAPADGFGLKLAGCLSGNNIPRITGADLTKELLKIANRQKFKVLILNWKNGLSKKEDIKKILNQKFSNLIFKIIDIERQKFLDKKIISEINNFQPLLIFNNLGFPYQEKLIYHNLKKIPSAKLALGIGGSFDFITHKIERAPKLLRRSGLEWLWRLIKQPQRWKRIYRATCVFMVKFLKNKLINCFFYRPNVLIILYQKEKKNNTKKDDIKILILRLAASQHWQLPQGGRDGESIIKSGQRELEEETGISKKDIKTIGKFKNLYHYKFPASFHQKNLNNISKRHYRHSGYKGQKQSLYIAELKNMNVEIRINFWDHDAWKWVPIDKLLETIQEPRKEGAQIFLKKLKSILN